MKTKITITFAMIAMLTIGFFGGRYFTNREWNQYVDHYFVYMKAANDSSVYVRVLTELHSNQQEDARNTLETMLDSSIIHFVNYDKVPREDFVVSAIQRAHDYRAKYPWSGSASYPDLNEAVKKVLSSEK